jgi:hypothetical protein
VTTVDERVRALDPWRFTPRQARFVVTVALHSGYCLRRQYMAFAGLQYGKVVRDFLDHLVARQIAVRERGRADRGFLYHLRARSIYRALGQEDNRNRRHASLAAIGRKLMLLDFVIAHPEVTWVATEEDKVDLFTHELGRPLTELPQQVYPAPPAAAAPTIRYFPHKWPIGVSPEPRRIHFVALALEPTGQAFARFLQDHAPVLAHLPAWTIVVLHRVGAAREADACRVAFDQFVLALPSTGSVDAADLRRFFVTRRAVERKDLTAFSVIDLNWFRDARARFADPTIETRYARWLVTGDGVLETPMAPTAGSVLSPGQLVVHALAFSYEQFGDFAGVC